VTLGCSCARVLMLRKSGAGAICYYSAMSTKSEPLDSQPRVPPVNALPPGQLYIGGERLPATFGISRPLAHVLAEEGLIKAVALERPGSKRVRKLYDVQSLKDYFVRCEYRPTGAPRRRMSPKVRKALGKAKLRRRRGRPRKVSA
jgi:hypothetical protein